MCLYEAFSEGDRLCPEPPPLLNFLAAADDAEILRTQMAAIHRADNSVMARFAERVQSRALLAGHVALVRDATDRLTEFCRATAEVR